MTVTMPRELLIGSVATMPLATHRGHGEMYAETQAKPNPYYLPGGEIVLGYRIPEWQRPAVWNQAQQIRFIESAWLGFSLGQIVVTQLSEARHPLDNLLIDGQQRMRALAAYWADEFAVFGARWSEVEQLDRRRFDFSGPTMGVMFLKRNVSEDQLRELYIRMNFGGTAHTESDYERVAK